MASWADERRSEARVAGGVGPIDQVVLEWRASTPTPARCDWPAGWIEFHPATATGCPGLRANGFVVEALHELYAPEDAQAHEHYDIATAQWARQRPSGES
jgi:hypothetical protein